MRVWTDAVVPLLAHVCPLQVAVSEHTLTVQTLKAIQLVLLRHSSEWVVVVALIVIKIKPRARQGIRRRKLDSQAGPH